MAKGSKQTILTPLFQQGSWLVSVELNVSRIFVVKKTPEGEKKVPVWVRHVYLICTNKYGTEVRFHPYKHKAANYEVRFSDSRTKELKGRGPKTSPYTIKEMVSVLWPWLGDRSQEAVETALATMEGTGAINPSEETEEVAVAA